MRLGGEIPSSRYFFAFYCKYSLFLGVGKQNELTERVYFSGKEQKEEQSRIQEEA